MGNGWNGPSKGSALLSAEGHFLAQPLGPDIGPSAGSPVRRGLEAVWNQAKFAAQSPPRKNFVEPGFFLPKCFRSPVPLGRHLAFSGSSSTPVGATATGSHPEVVHKTVLSKYSGYPF